MTSRTPKLRALAVVAVAAAVTAIVPAAGAGGRSAVLDPGRSEFLFSATQIIILPGGNPATDSSIARLDTRTGALYRFRGSVDNPSAASTWELRVPPVDGETSGLLEIQVVTPERTANLHDPTPRMPAVFLVDIVSGYTWILQARASSNLSWEPVEIYRSAQYY
jgi:hypothetical protein